MLARGILGSGRTRGVSFRPFPNSSGWWWLISSIFLIRISCHKTTQVNGYYGAWPGWVVSISVLPLTISCLVLTIASWLHTDFSGGRWGGLVFLQNFQCVVIHIVKGFGIVNKAEANVFLELSCFFYDPVDVGNLISDFLPFLNPAWDLRNLV